MKKGSFPDKYKPVDTSVSHGTTPGIAIIAGWLMMMVIGAYFADEIRIHAEDSTDQTAKPTLAIGKAFQDIANQTGLSTIKKKIEPKIHRLYDAQMKFGEPPPAKPIVEKIIIQGKAKTNDDCDDICKEKQAIKERPISNILIVGSSSMRHELGRHLEKKLESDAQLIVQRHAKVGTGLARPDVYNWPKITLSLIAKHNPQLVVAQFIGNDCQALINVDKSIVARKHDENWPEAYKARVISFIESIQDTGANLVLIGMPIVRSPIFRKRLEKANRIVEEAAKETGAIYLPIWKLSLDQKGGYREEIRYKGQTRPFRQADGIHFSRDGARFVANGIFEELERRFGYRFNAQKSAKP